MPRDSAHYRALLAPLVEAVDACRAQVDDSLELQYVLVYEDIVAPFYFARHIGIPP